MISTYPLAVLGVARRRRVGSVVAGVYLASSAPVKTAVTKQAAASSGLFSKTATSIAKWCGNHTKSCAAFVVGSAVAGVFSVLVAKPFGIRVAGSRTSITSSFRAIAMSSARQIHLCQVNLHSVGKLFFVMRHSRSITESALLWDACACGGRITNAVR